MYLYDELYIKDATERQRELNNRKKEEDGKQTRAETETP